MHGYIDLNQPAILALGVRSNRRARTRLRASLIVGVFRREICFEPYKLELEKMMNKSLSNLIVGAGLAGSLLFTASVVHADPSEWAKADYMNYCASCHGADGTGNGPMQDQLKGKPTDLTVLTKDNGGVFPYLKVYKTIDGTWDQGNLRAHGSNEMPIWGDVFRRTATVRHGYMETKGRIMTIIQYIESLQKK
jgi:mono/diheme cytochrome c family protein